MKVLFIVSILTLFFCVPDCAAAEAAATPDAVRIRVANVSEIPFSEVVIGFGGREEDFGSLEPGRTSEYHSVGLAYRYEGYRIVAGGTPYRAITADHLGDERLQAGSYTYTINVYGGQLIFGLIVDED